MSNKTPTFLLSFFLFFLAALPSFAGSTDSLRDKWTFIIEPGVTTIDFAIGSSSNEFKLDGQFTGILSSLKLYDSRQNYFPPSVGPFTDQANHYLLTAKNENSGWVFSFGILHDKREQRPNMDDNRFRYRKGGFNLTLQTGRQWDWPISKKNLVYFQQRIGLFVAFNDLDIHLLEPIQNHLYINSKDSRKYAGGGLVATTQIAYAYAIKKSWSISLSINGTVMKGKASTKVSTFDSGLTLVNQNQSISLGFMSFSLGPSLNIIYRR